MQKAGEAAVEIASHAYYLEEILFRTSKSAQLPAVTFVMQLFLMLALPYVFELTRPQAVAMACSPA